MTLYYTPIIYLIFHIAVIFLTKLSVVFLSLKTQNFIKDKTWNFTLKLDDFKIKPWLKSIKTNEPLFEGSWLSIPTKRITIVAFISFSIVYYYLFQFMNFNDEGIITNKEFFLKVRIISYISSLLFFIMLILFLKKYLNKYLISGLTFFLFFKSANNIVGIIALLIIYYKTGEIDCEITKFQTFDCKFTFYTNNIFLSIVIRLFGAYLLYFLTFYLSKIISYISYSITFIYVTITDWLLNLITKILYKISDYKSGVLKGHIIVITAFIEIITLIYELIKKT